ncbi:MAG: alkyl sulfatase dimerization domain-containing protein [Acidimicrobiales bacterium]
MDIVELSDRRWRGEDLGQKTNPLGAIGHVAEITDDTAFLANFANCTAISTSDGLVMVDTGSPLTAELVHQEIRTWSALPLRSAVFSHGHIDHVFGVGPFEDEASTNGWAKPHVIAHERVSRRFDRYLMTHGYNEIINQRQFASTNLQWPTAYRYPDETYDLEHDFAVGATQFHLRHEKGETDDATVTWIPETGVLCSGDLFIWNSPNAGNPQKVQRYPLEWAQALRRMVDLQARYLLPGHGLPVIGRDRIRQALSETAEYLESLVEQTLALMNDGARLADALANVKVPRHLEERPYLQPYYDEPEFIVRNVWRLYGGWWDGNPANLRPAHERALAAELADLAGGVNALCARAESLLEDGSDEGLRLAGHLAETAWLASPSDPGVQDVRRRVFHALAANATSTMSRGIFSWAEREASSEGSQSSRPTVAWPPDLARREIKRP